MANYQASIERDAHDQVVIHDVPKEMEIRVDRFKEYRRIKLGEFEIVIFDKE